MAVSRSFELLDQEADGACQLMDPMGVLACPRSVVVEALNRLASALG